MVKTQRIHVSNPNTCAHSPRVCRGGRPPVFLALGVALKLELLSPWSEGGDEDEDADATEAILV